MRIQNNIMAMNTHRFYTVNNNAVAKSAEKLSPGYRVNRAGDDAAGLAISEKMRAEIRGLAMASKNSQDGISMVQTAEGALTEVQAMLQRMKELAVQAASDSNEDEIDRPALDQEFQQLIKEIDDVSMTTTFNDMKLLDGSFQNKVIQIGSRTGNEMEISIGNMNAAALGLAEKTGTQAITASGTVAITEAGADAVAQQTAATAKFEITLTGDTGHGSGDVLTVKDGQGNTIATLTSDGTTYAVGSVATGYTGAYASGKLTLTSSTANTSISETSPFGNITIDKTTDTDGSISGTPAVAGTWTDGNAAVAAADAKTAVVTASITGAASGEGNVTMSITTGTGDTLKEVASVTAKVTDADGDGTITAEETAAALADKTFTLDGKTFTATVADGATDVVFTAGAAGDVASLDDANVAGTVAANNGGEVNLLDQDSASEAIDRCRDALNLVSTQRAELGAIQNRLEHKISNLDNTVENISAAESRIRDVDIAKEMTNFTKNNILSQAATAMLAQANANPQGVLSLLQ